MVRASPIPEQSEDPRASSLGAERASAHAIGRGAHHRAVRSAQHRRRVLAVRSPAPTAVAMTVTPTRAQAQGAIRPDLRASRLY
jgi:hypothetical protein